MAINAPQETVDAINNDEDQPDFSPLEEGYYLCEAVEAKEKDIGPSGYGGVGITFKVIQPREYRGRKLWVNLSWSPKAAWKIREFWDALGYEYDSDFEEIVESAEQAILVVEQEIVARGKNKGQVGNKVETVLAATDEAIAGLRA